MILGTAQIDITPQPGVELSGFAEGGIKRGAFAISIEFERLNFGQSDKVGTSKLSSASGAVIQNSQAFQPDSQSSLLSLNFAYSF